MILRRLNLTTLYPLTFLPEGPNEDTTHSILVLRLVLYHHIFLILSKISDDDRITGYMDGQVSSNEC
jgi:hypothetical protein